MRILNQAAILAAMAAMSLYACGGSNESEKAGEPAKSEVKETTEATPVAAPEETKLPAAKAPEPAPTTSTEPAGGSLKEVRTVTVAITSNPPEADLFLLGEAEEETAIGKAPYTHTAEIEIEREVHAGGADRFFINPGGKGISYELTYPDGSSSTVIHFSAKQGEKKGELKIVLNPHAMWEKKTEFREEITLQ